MSEKQSASGLDEPRGSTHDLRVLPYKPCRWCTSPHHLNCWTEHGGCAIPGCAGAPEAEPGQPRDQRAVGSADPVTAPPQRRQRPGPRSSRRAILAATAAVCLLLAGFAVRPILDRVLTQASDGQEERTAEDGTNPQYLADLVRKGPFTESLPSPLVPGSLRDVRIADSSSALKLDAVELEVETGSASAEAFPDLPAFAHMEIYSTREEASRRGNSSL